jgi:hypothetical protein
MSNIELGNLTQVYIIEYNFRVLLDPSERIWVVLRVQREIIGQSDLPLI